MSGGSLNLALLAERAFEQRGDHPSLLFEGRWHGSGELFERAARLAAGLRELGAGPGDRVVVSMANCPEVGVAYNAIWRAGAVVTPATFLLPAAELRHVVSDSGAAGVITTPEFADKVREATAGLEHVRFVLSAGDETWSRVETLAPAPITPREDDDLAALLYTGGTTGRAKGVMLSHANLHFSGRSAFEVAHIPGVNRAIATLPLSHSYGILVTLAGMHNPEPGVTVLLRWFHPAAFLVAIAEHELQIGAVVPTMLQILLAQPLDDYRLDTLRHLSCGGAPLAPEVEAEFRRRLPHVRIRQGYGLTETAALIATSPDGRERPGSVGVPVPGCTVTVVDDAGRELPPGEAGEICATSPGVMQGYWHSPEATSEALRGGRLHTGDIGYLDADGHLYIVDRKKDLIIRGGFNVYPRDIEDALLQHPDVTVAAVVGRPDPRHGEEIVAVVSLRAHAKTTAGALVAWAREQIGGYRYPREIEIVEQVPLTPVGKIDRKAVRAAIASGSDAGGAQVRS